MNMKKVVIKMSKHIVIKNHNGTEWEILYPETSADQVVTETGETLDIVLTKKVDKVEGKQLSTEDFTTELKTKLEEVQDSVVVSETEPLNTKGLWFELK